MNIRMHTDKMPLVLSLTQHVWEVSVVIVLVSGIKFINNKQAFVVIKWYQTKEYNWDFIIERKL